MRVSECFKLGRTQPSLDFVDVHVDTDTPVFVDPNAIRGLDTTWGAECRSLLQHFFQHVIGLITAGDDAKAIELLASLNERNEFHLGFSQGESRGHGFGSGHAGNVWEAFAKSKAAKSGLLQDLEDTCLLIEGIGPDMISDAVCNIIRGPLIRYTQDMCRFYGIPLISGVASGAVWNATLNTWESDLVELPIATYGPVLLVPKTIARYRFSFSNDEYYRHYLLPQLQQEALAGNSALVQVLKDGRRKVTKKSLSEKYGAGKLVCVDLSIPRPAVLDKYRAAKRAKARVPMSHDDIAEVVATSSPDWDALLASVTSVLPGKAGATAYEAAVEALLTALFYPALSYPYKQHPIHQGRKRIDITYVNSATNGFFAWLGTHYPSSHIFVECKNYGAEIGNPELDQLSGRFSPNRGKVGLLVCRSIKDAATLAARCRDTANDGRGFILALDDNKLRLLVDERKQNHKSQEYSELVSRFRELVS